MQKPKITALAAALVFISPGIAPAAVPHVFESGDPARADQVNENFSNLDQRLAQVESGQEQAFVEVDCTSNPNEFLETELRSNTLYELTGMCHGPIWIDKLDNVSIEGDDVGSKDDGIMLPGGLSEHPWGAIGVWRSKNISLYNLTVSSANYVAQSYSFGENVATLTAGDQSFVEVASVDFVGGDYSVDIYNASQLAIYEDVTVTGFNRIGLAGFNHALIRTHDDITVTGLQGSSTDNFPYAFSSVNNSIVEIRDGGEFTGPTGQPGDGYATGIWAGDNGTIRIRGSDNGTTINGAVESAYSSMIRINGDTTINGAMGSYHRGYIRASGVTQSGGPIWSGDASTIRFESGSITPSNAVDPDDAFSIYRQGNVRMNNTTVNMNGNPIWVGGFGVLNLRGSTNLGGADIDCDFSRADVSIRNTVTNVNSVCGSPAP